SPAEHEFNVSATVTSIGSFPASQFGLTDEFGGTITVLPYAELIVDLNSMTRSIDSGDSFEVLVEASNNGNGYLSAHFGFSQETADELISAGFTFVSTDNSSISWSVSTGLYSDIEGKSFNYVLLAPSFEEDREFEVEYCGTIESVGVDAMSAEDVTNSEPICDSFKLKVAAEPKDALGSVGSAIGIDDQTMMMMIIGGGGGMGLLLVMMIVLKVNKRKKARIAAMVDYEDDDFDDDFDEIDDDDLDFGDL
ncbi:MAG: hypothetical protein QGH90_00390, partial [Candidatus Poseidoniaceae archaeon]|nr:hypothetical protein [Candidatus Poseidoniaceae archaeon]